MANSLAKKTHPKGPCTSRDCFRPFCAGYRLGYDEGFADGLAACPGPHT